MNRHSARRPLVHQTQAEHQLGISPGYPEKPKQMVNTLLTSCTSSGVFKTMDERLEQLVTKAHIRNRPDANFQAIVLARFSRKSWEEISE